MQDLFDATFRGRPFLLLALFATATFTASAEPRLGERKGRLAIRLYDYANLDPGLIAKTRKVTSSVLAKAGIGTRWEQCRTTDRELNRNSSCSQPVDICVLQLRFQFSRRATQLNRSALQYGYALTLPSGRGVIAGVFIDRIRTLASEEGGDLHVLLGHVIAHELGHLLLGSNSHARQGIMRAKWRSAELQRAQMGTLRFTPAQVQLMRKQVNARLLAQSAGRTESFSIGSTF